MPFEPFSDEQARALINLEQRYGVWMEASRLLAAMPYDLRRKNVGEYSYLYEIFDRGGNGTSLGRWSADTAQRLDDYRQAKAALKERVATSRAALNESGQLCRALRVPFLASAAAPILHEADRRAMLDGRLLVVGTNAMVAYAVEAGAFLRDAPDETEDFDLAWCSEHEVEESQSIWPMLKAVDPTFTVNSERGFQARNSAAYEVEILVAPSRAKTLPRRDQPRPVPLPEQEWLITGRPVDRVVACRNGDYARLVVPDPRWFALHKLWLSDKAGRDARKRPKDRKQGLALLDAVRDRMPHYPLDECFEANLPKQLRMYLAHWRDAST